MMENILLNLGGFLEYFELYLFLEIIYIFRHILIYIIIIFWSIFVYNFRNMENWLSTQENYNPCLSPHKTFTFASYRCLKFTIKRIKKRIYIYDRFVFNMIAFYPKM